VAAVFGRDAQTVPSAGHAVEVPLIDVGGSLPVEEVADAVHDRDVQVVGRSCWFSVSDEEQERRLRARRDDPLRSWKLSPMDPQSIIHWEDYSRAKDTMMVHTDIAESPWYVVESDDKRAARLNMVAHLLSTLEYHDVAEPAIKLPKRPKATGYQRPPREEQRYVPDHAATLAH